MGFMWGVLVGYVVFALVEVVVSRRRNGRPRERELVSVPIDSMLTFAVYDAEGNQLTERAPFCVGGAGTNTRAISSRVIRSGRVHHGISFVGEYGMVMDVEGDVNVVAGDTYVIAPGNWTTDLKPL